MLVHKTSKGILEEIWTGELEKVKINKVTIEVPLYKKCTFKNTYLENPDEWWEINIDSVLGRKIKKFYPWIDFVVDENGRLVDVLSQKMEENKEKREKLKEEKKKEAENRGYKSRTNIRPKNLMPFLKVRN